MSLLLAATMAGMMAAGVDLSSASVDDDERYRIEVLNWRADRLARLKKPDSWLALIGLHWLKDGDNRVGSAKDNDVVLAKGPAKIGVVNVSGDQVTVTLEKGSALINGSESSKATMRDDSNPRPTTVAFDTVYFYLISREGKKALRVKDAEAATLKNFKGLDYFDLARNWRVEAKWEAFNPPKTMEIPTVTGGVEKYTVPGKAVFERDGKKYEVQPVLESPDAKELFLIFADKTSGKETYGAARFLYAPLPVDGKVVLDFNKAYNPPCAFTPYATCPLAPPENKLNLRVTAGEKKYKGAAH